jgi:hypothetical protein
MTQQEHDDLVLQGLVEVGKKIRRSKKFARQFLIDAGIIPDIIPDLKEKKVAKKKK